MPRSLNPLSFSPQALRAACAAFVLLLGAGAAPAQPPADSTATAASDSSPAYLAARARWKKALDAFDAADRAQPPTPGGFVFVGSSSIRMWRSLARDFGELPVVINRGFGGSTMADCSLLARELVVRYRPRQVLVYAGDNDLAEGRTPLDVLHDFAQFMQAVRAALPDTRIGFISVKPSPSREALLPQIRETNHIVAAYLRTQANSDFIDVFTPMLGADGRPRGELFQSDRLHLNEAGYRLWHDLIEPYLHEAPTARTAATGRGPTPLSAAPGP